jgi:hypothetical protein
MTVEQGKRGALDGVTPSRCATCKRFARLLPGEAECPSCAGVLALVFVTITVVRRGGHRA